MTRYFAVFGDVHGRVALMLTLARRWQQETGLRLDGILQAGDMGAFPDHHRLDSSTLRYAKKDPDELGFRDFLHPGPEGEALLAPEDSPPIVFCRGNHEDFGYLEPFRGPATLDPWGKLWFVPDGCTIDLGPTRIAAFGGAPPSDPSTGRGRSAREGRRKAARQELHLGMGPRFHERDLDRALRREPGPIDVLLTHAGPAHDGWQGGSEHLTRLADRWRPRVHLFGHHHEVVGPLQTPSGLLVGLEHLFFRGDGQVQPGSWGILELDPGAARFAFVLRETHPWSAEVHRWGWREG